MYRLRIKHLWGSRDRVCRIKVAELQPLGSSLKFCMAAEGKVALYPHLGQTMKGETAAGYVVVEDAGGTVTTADGLPGK